MYKRILLSLCLCLDLAPAMTAPVAAAEPVVVMGAGAEPLTKDQVTQVYLGRSNALKPLDLPDSNPLHDEFYKKATARDAAQIKAVWSRIIFTGQGQPPKELPDAAAVKRADRCRSKNGRLY
jgi:hypothetical protein